MSHRYKSHGITTIFLKMGKIIILSVIRDQRSSNCTTATKVENYTATVSVFRATWNSDRRIIGNY